jgi:hypothetical protein
MGPKLLTDNMKKVRVRISKEFLKMVRQHLMSMLDNIVTMNESAISFHTAETKQQSKQWHVKGMPGPIKTIFHATRKNQMALAFFDPRASSTQILCPGAKLLMLLTSLRPFWLLESFKGEETNDDDREQVVSSGQCPCSHLCCGDQPDGGQAVPDH